MTLLLALEYKGYTIEARHDDDCENPLTDADIQPVVVLHNKANRRFGWTTDKDWGDRLNYALDELAERNAFRSLTGPTGMLTIIDRWLRIFYQTRSFPFSAIDHGGVAVYLGAGTAIGDAAGWDSGWVGWILYNAELAKWPEITAEQLDNNLRAAFEEFSCWVSGDTYGYEVTSPDGDRTVEECWGMFGLDNLRDDDGWMRKELEANIDFDIAHTLNKEKNT